MEKDYSLQCLDYAILQTKAKGDEFDKTSYLTKAVNIYMTQGNGSGFTRTNDARSYIVGDPGRGIPGINKDDIEEQLLKHVIKAASVKERKGHAQRLGTNLDFSTVQTPDDAQIVMYQAMGAMHMEGIRYALNQHPQMYELLAANFVEERYYNHNMGAAELDQPMNSHQNAYYYQKIDEYYNDARTNSR